MKNIILIVACAGQFASTLLTPHKQQINTTARVPFFHRARGLRLPYVCMLLDSLRISLFYIRVRNPTIRVIYIEGGIMIYTVVSWVSLEEAIYYGDGIYLEAGGVLPPSYKFIPTSVYIPSFPVDPSSVCHNLFPCTFFQLGCNPPPVATPPCVYLCKRGVSCCWWLNSFMQLSYYAIFRVANATTIRTSLSVRHPSSVFLSLPSTKCYFLGTSKSLHLDITYFIYPRP